MLTAGSIIQKERMRQKISLEEVSAATKIQKHYLEALENDEYQKFQSTVFAKGFLRNYARYLGIDPERVIALFRRSVEHEAVASVNESKRTIQNIKFAITPSTIVIASIVFLILFTFGYLFFQFYNFQKPPKLEISSPENNITVDSGEIIVKGKTESNMFVTINDEPIRINDDGSFSVNINLREGQNTLIIKSKHPDDIGKEAIISRQIEYKPATQDIEEGAGENTEEEPIKKTKSVVVEIKNESAWIEIKIDGKPEVTSIVLPGTKLEYQAENTISITTGKVTATSVLIDGESVTPYISDEGIGIIQCDIENNILNCQQP